MSGTAPSMSSQPVTLGELRHRNEAAGGGVGDSIARRPEHPHHVVGGEVWGAAAARSGLPRALGAARDPGGVPGRIVLLVVQVGGVDLSNDDLYGCVRRPRLPAADGHDRSRARTRELTSLFGVIP